MRVLIACEESQVVCKAFREKGHEAYSCDIIDCSGGHPEWHIKQDVLEILNPHQISSMFYGIVFKTVDGNCHAIDGKLALIWRLVVQDTLRRKGLMADKGKALNSSVSS